MWIAIEQQLPADGESVALVDINRWENTGSDLVRNVHACGYLTRVGMLRFWSVHGQRAIAVEAFTHWTRLDPVPHQPDCECPQCPERKP